MRALISCGGTGGHIFPAMAIAEALREEHPGIELFLAGVKGSMEEEMAHKYDISFVPVEAHMMAGFSMGGKLKSVLSLVRSSVRMRRWIREHRPDFLVCTGGFVTGAPIIGAILTGTPYFLHEQNVFPGLANRQFSPHARKIFISYEESKEHMRAKEDVFVLSGNPVRSVFFTLERDEIRKCYGFEGKTILLSSGGSIGSDSFNDFVSDAGILLERHPDLQWIHASGPDLLPDIREKYGSTARLEVHSFIEEMPQMVFAADLVLSRAGAITLSENAFAGRAAVLLPSPYVAADHQKGNARMFGELGAARVFEDADLYDPQTRRAVFAALDELLRDDQAREEMGKRARALAQQDAARLIARTCLEEVGA